MSNQGITIKFYEVKEKLHQQIKQTSWEKNTYELCTKNIVLLFSILRITINIYIFVNNKPA